MTAGRTCFLTAIRPRSFSVSLVPRQNATFLANEPPQQCCVLYESSKKKHDRHAKIWNTTIDAITSVVSILSGHRSHLLSTQETTTLRHEHPAFTLQSAHTSLGPHPSRAVEERKATSPRVLHWMQAEMEDSSPCTVQKSFAPGGEQQMLGTGTYLPDISSQVQNKLFYQVEKKIPVFLSFQPSAKWPKQHTISIQELGHVAAEHNVLFCFVFSSSLKNFVNSVSNTKANNCFITLNNWSSCQRWGSFFPSVL